LRGIPFREVTWSYGIFFGGVESPLLLELGQYIFYFPRQMDVIYWSKKKAAKLLNINKLDRDAFDVTNRNSRPLTEFTLGNPAIGLAVKIDLCKVLVHI